MSRWIGLLLVGIAASGAGTATPALAQSEAWDTIDESSSADTPSLRERVRERMETRQERRSDRRAERQTRRADRQSEAMAATHASDLPLEIEVPKSPERRRDADGGWGGCLRALLAACRTRD